MSYEVVESARRPELEEQARAEFRTVWPEFIFHDETSARYLDRVEEYFSRFDLALLLDGRLVAGGWGVPLRWAGTVADLPAGYDGALARSVDGHESGTEADTLAIMAAAVATDLRGRGLAGRILTALREVATGAGLAAVICPVRPTLKIRYPLVSMADFATWHRDDGLHLDPWIRTHQRLGATILAPAPDSMVITGTVGEWESWTGMAFPQSGAYVVPEALDLVRIDRDTDVGTYREPNLWMRHC